MELIRKLLLGACVLACGWLDPRLPPVGSRLRLPEFLFGALALASLPLLRVGGVLAVGLGVFLATRTLSALVHGDWVELAGNFYLAGVALTVQALVRAYGERPLQVGFLALGLASSALAGAGWLTASPLLARTSPPYPYLGEVPRAMGLTGHPNMLASLLAVSLLVTVGSGRGRPWQFAAMGFGLALTLSKTSLALAVAGLAQSRRGWPLAALLLVVWLAGVHWLRPGPELVTWSYCEPFAPGAAAVPSVYLVTKRTALTGFVRSPLVGVGPFPQFVQGESEAGRYRLRQLYDPHCTYLGVAAEHGLLGLAGLAALVGTVVILLRRRREPWWRAVFVFFALEALVTDELNFRHLWILLGWLAA